MKTLSAILHAIAVIFLIALANAATLDRECGTDSECAEKYCPAFDAECRANVLEPEVNQARI